MLTVVLSIIIQNELKPYYTVTMNRMEIFSLSVAALTMYSGMYYVTGQHYDYMDNDTIKYFILMLVATPNVTFFIYWLYHIRIEILKELFKKKYFSFIALLTLRKYNPNLFYEKYLKHDEAFEKIEE